MRRYLLLVTQTLGWLAVFALGALLALVVMASTPRGMHLIGLVANRYTLQLATPVELRNLGGTLWRGPTLERLTVYDSQGPWLVLDDLRINWRLNELWHGRPFITQASLANGQLERLPEMPASMGTESESRGFEPEEIFPFLPQAVRVGRFVVGPAITGRSHVLAADIRNSGQPWAYDMHLESLQGVSTTLAGTLVADPTQPSADLHFYEAPGGLLGSLAKVAASDSISLTLLAATHNGLTTLERGSVQIGKSQGDVHGTFAHGDGGVVASLSATVPNLRQWQALVSSTIDGRLGARMDVSGTWPQLGTSTTLGFATGMRQAQLAFGGSVNPLAPSVSGTLGGVLVNGKVRYPLTGWLSATPDAAEVRGLRLTGPGVTVAADGAWTPTTASATVQVDVPRLAAFSDFVMPGLEGNLKFNVSGTLSDNVPHLHARVEALKLAYQGRLASLKAPVSLDINDQTAVLSAMLLEVGGGTVQAYGRVSPTALDVLVTLHNVKPQLLMNDDVLTGRVDGSLQASGTPAAPVLALQAALRGESSGIPLTANLTGGWRGNALNARGVVTLNNVPLQAEATLGARLKFYPFQTTLDDSTPLQGRINGVVELAQFNPYLWASRQTVGGKVTVNGSLGGTLGQPQVTGGLNLTGGSYRHTTTGLCLDDITASLRGDTTRIILQSLTATAPKGGSLHGQGTLGLAGEKLVAATISLTKLHLFCGGLIAGEASGSLAASGTLADNQLAGALTLGPLNIQIPGNDGTISIPQIETVRAGEKAATSSGTHTRLNVAINAPQQVFVRGRGLDAELGGRLVALGNAHSPVINGALNVIRGTFALFGRTLTLTKETSIQFTGPIPPSPFLDVHATSTVQDTSIALALTGSALKPQIQLSSVPVLPQDEVLAMLLFGQRLQSISPFQALQLAQAARTLSGEDGGQPGLIDQARQRLGLDALDIGSDNDNNVTVTTGKYIANDVFLSVRQGATPEDRQVKTELELTPSISGYTQVDGLGVQTFGLNWKRDY